MNIYLDSCAVMTATGNPFFNLPDILFSLNGIQQALCNHQADCNCIPPSKKLCRRNLCCV